jgi:hypothetical protein
MYEYDILLPERREMLYPDYDELDTFLEYNTDNYLINRRHVIFSVNGNSAVRNEKYDPYFKMFPDCTVSLNSLTKKNVVYRIFFKRPVYTSHSGPGTTPEKMSKLDILLLMDSFIMIVDSKLNKGVKRYLWEELKAAANAVMGSDLIFYELPEKGELETRESYSRKLKAEIERIKQETEMYWDITYDGKR